MLSGAEVFALATFAGLGLVTLWYLVVVFRGRQTNVSWTTILLAGPMVAIRPKLYLTPLAANKIPNLVFLWVFLFVLVAASGAAVSE
jgi:hypothetical protein